VLTCALQFRPVIILKWVQKLQNTGCLCYRLARSKQSLGTPVDVGGTEEVIQLALSRRQPDIRGSFRRSWWPQVSCGQDSDCAVTARFRYSRIEILNTDSAIVHRLTDHSTSDEAYFRLPGPVNEQHFRCWNGELSKKAYECPCRAQKSQLGVACLPLEISDCTSLEVVSVQWP
jgi:hypothetical protein